VDEVKGMMAENIELLLERGQKLEEMDEKVRARARGRGRARVRVRVRVRVRALLERGQKLEEMDEKVRARGRGRARGRRRAHASSPMHPPWHTSSDALAATIG